MSFFMINEEEVVSYVIDNGSYEIKWGIAGEDSPNVIKEYKVGMQPVKDGKIENWDLMESIWSSVFYETDRDNNY